MFANFAGVAYTDRIHRMEMESFECAKEGPALIHELDPETSSRPICAAPSTRQAAWSRAFLAEVDNVSIPRGLRAAASGRMPGHERVTRWMGGWLRRLWTRLRDAWHGQGDDDFDELDVTGWCVPVDA